MDDDADEYEPPSMWMLVIVTAVFVIVLIGLILVMTLNHDAPQTP